MNKQNPIVDKTMKQIASKIIRADLDKWPPDCCLFSYQPRRPAAPPEKSRESHDLDFIRVRFPHAQLPIRIFSHR